ncbi:MAG TPA: 50S ribosomal protein L5 [Candidatus Babeliaceae bacterium]|nr:50S ribosomal protein L5 [Candidatus Babeliaceae bacterium]
MAKARLEELYIEELRPQLKEKLQLDNIMEVPKLSKIVVNVGVKEAVADSRVLQTVSSIIEAITGQAPVKTVAKKSIAGFKIREGMQIGVMVTLRKQKMYEFLDKLINLALPKVRDFQGVSRNFDRRGNYTLGIRDSSIFPEAEVAGGTDKSCGMSITFHTTAKGDDQAFELLNSFGMPFRRSKGVK